MQVDTACSVPVTVSDLTRIRRKQLKIWGQVIGIVETKYSSCTVWSPSLMTSGGINSVRAPV